jgi:hypothetical protein
MKNSRPDATQPFSSFEWFTEMSKFCTEEKWPRLGRALSLKQQTEKAQLRIGIKSALCGKDKFGRRIPPPARGRVEIESAIAFAPA